MTSISWNYRQAPGHPISHVPQLLKGTLPLKRSSAKAAPAAAGGGPLARIFACRRDVAAGSPPHTPRPGARGVARRLLRRRLRGRRRGGRSVRAAPTGLRDRAQGGPVLRATRRRDPRAPTVASALRLSELRSPDPGPCSAQPLGGRGPRG